MSLLLSGTNGLSDVDGSAATPAIRGTDTNTGIFFPAADSIGFSEGGAEIARFDSSGNLGIGTSSPNNVMTTYRGSGVNNYIQFTNATTGTTSTDGCLIGVSADDTALRLRVLESAPMIFTTNDTECMRLDSSGNLRFNSGYGSVATAYGCRAWVNFNGTGTVAIRASGNVSSIGDSGTGTYVVNLTNAMPDSNYSVTTCIYVQSSWTGPADEISSMTTSSFSMQHRENGSTVDSAYMRCAVFR
jgi:hypothetical protein